MWLSAWVALAACRNADGDPADGASDGTGASASAEGPDSATAGNSNSNSNSNSDGTAGSDDNDPDNSDNDDPTDDTGSTANTNWHEHIAPIVIASCTGCHREGGVAPFSFETYELAAPFAPAMAIVVDQRTMPPFAADQTDECTPPHGFVDDPRLTDDEIALVAAWSDAGAPEGDPDLAAEIPAVPQTVLEDPDLVVPIGGAVTIEGTQDSFICFSIDPGLDQDVLVSALQIIPGNGAIVHHVLIYEDTTGQTAGEAGPDGWYPCSQAAGQGQLIAGWAPGGQPLVFPEGVARRIDADSRIVLNVHYHPTAISAEIDDSTAVALKFFDGTPQYQAGYRFIGNAVIAADGLQPGPNDDGFPQFMIPAGQTGHTEEMRILLGPGEPQTPVFRIAAHMHYVGTEMLIRVLHPDGSEECLVHTPRFDFNWQRGYIYDALVEDMPTIGAGDEVYLRCTYDNTLANPGVVQALQDQGLDAPVDVYYGEGTLDEMCLGTFMFAGD